MPLLSLLAQTSTSNGEGQGDLLSDVGSEIRVVIDRWSAGQIGLSDLAIAAAIFAVAAVLSFFVRHQARRLTARLDSPAATAGLVIGRLISLGVYLFATGLVLEVLGFTLGPVLMVALVIWAALVFARPMMQDLNSGLDLQLRGALRIGDLVETNGMLGTVEGVNTRSVVLVTGDGKTIELPSREVAERALVNMSTLGRRRSSMALSLPEGTDVVETTDRLLATVAGVGHVLDEPPPEVVITGFDGTRTSITILYWHGPEQWAERLASDRVGRSVLTLLTTEGFALSDPAIVVKEAGMPPIGWTSAQ